MSLTFEPLKTGAPGVFGVRLCGSAGRAEKARLKEFADKCLGNGKLRIVLDVQELDAIGGGGAAFLASFQRDLAARGGGLAFAGANDVVRRFLALQFGQLPLLTLDDVPGAVAALAAAVPATAEASAAPPAGDAAPDGAADDGSGLDGFALDGAADAASPDSALDDLLGSYAGGPTVTPRARPAATVAPAPAAGAEAAPEAAAGEAPAAGAIPEPGRAAIPSDAPAAAGADGAARPHFVTLETALAELRAAREPAALERPLRNLLHSFDLAAGVVFCARRDEVFAATDGSATLSVAGPLAVALAAAGRPLSLLELGELELPEDEARLLADLRADVAVPLAREGKLAAVVFVRRRGESQEYGVSETFALSLLARLFAEDGGPAAPARTAESPTAAAAGDAAARRDLPAELRRKVAQMQALFSISEDLARVREPGRLTELLCATVMAQLGVRSVAVLELEGETLLPRIARGVELERVPSLQPCGPQPQAWLVEQPLPAPVSELPPLFNRFKAPLTEAGFSFLASLRTRGQLLGVVLLGDAMRDSRPDLDLDFLSTLLNQAAIAMDNARMLHQAHEQGIGVIRTLVSLVEQRQQAGGRMTDRVAQLAAETARELGFPAEKMRDLVYGTVLRDIGMIPISDLVLRSPRKLSEGEWKQVKGHPETGAELLGPLQLPPTVRDVVLFHHERFNGEGYPRGLQGRAIPLSARIVSVVESYVAMVSDLPYRTALSEAEAVSILSENWGMRYDPDVVEAFLRVLARTNCGNIAEAEPVGAADAWEPRS